MPVHIQELVIRAIVDRRGGGGKEAPTEKDAAPDREELIKECVERVLEILAEKDER